MSVSLVISLSRVVSESSGKSESFGKFSSGFSTVPLSGGVEAPQVVAEQQAQTLLLDNNLDTKGLHRRQVAGECFG